MDLVKRVLFAVFKTFVMCLIVLAILGASVGYLYGIGWLANEFSIWFAVFGFGIPIGLFFWFDGPPCDPKYGNCS